MSVQVVREYLKPFHLDERIREFSVSSATVELAAVAVGVEEAHCQNPFLFFRRWRRMSADCDCRRYQNRQQAV